MTRREYAAGIVSRVIREHEQAEEKEIRKALRDAYPWGQRAMHPYKIWSDEVRRQLAERRGEKITRPRPGYQPPPPDPQQIKLF